MIVRYARDRLSDRYNGFWLFCYARDAFLVLLRYGRDSQLGACDGQVIGKFLAI